MASIIASTFTCFPELPIELQKMVWEEAAADLPVLSMQRFNAEITLSQRNTHPQSQSPTLLCFTPHADYIEITTGHRGLLRACRQSRIAARQQIDCLLPIHFFTTTDTGKRVPRQGLVPFNTSGQFCISGLPRAIQNATEGRGGRGVRGLRHRAYSCP